MHSARALFSIRAIQVMDIYLRRNSHQESSSIGGDKKLKDLIFIFLTARFIVPKLFIWLILKLVLSVQAPVDWPC